MNEEANVQAFVDSCAGADLISIYDTGSTDGTIELLKKNNAFAGGSVCTQPLDFGAARNLALDCLPDDVDVVVSIDMDERLQPGWREALEKTWDGSSDSISYWYIAEWADEEKTIPSSTAWRSKIFNPKTMRWFRRIHEIPLMKNGSDPSSKFCREIEVRHYQTGQRDYSGQLTEFLKEYPEDTNGYIQRAAEYLKMGENRKAIDDYTMFLRLTEKNECENKECGHCKLIEGKRAYCWLEIAQAKHKMGVKPMEIIQCFLHATAECPSLREAWTYLADGWRSVENYEAAYAAAMNALRITDNGINARDERCWGELPRQIANGSLRKMMERLNPK